MKGILLYINFIKIICIFKDNEVKNQYNYSLTN